MLPGSPGRGLLYSREEGGVLQAAGGGGGRKMNWKLSQTRTCTYPMLIFPTTGMPYFSGMLKLPEMAVATITWKYREQSSEQKECELSQEH